MTLQINIAITADEFGKFNSIEEGVLAALSGNTAWPPAEAKAAAQAATPAPAPAPKAAPKAAPAPAPKAAPKAAPKPAPAPVDETPMALDASLDEPEVEAPAEEAEVDLLGGEEEAATYTKDDALAKATALISAQKQSVVKTALAAAAKVNPKVKRVSDLNDDASIQAFMAALED